MSFLAELIKIKGELDEIQNVEDINQQTTTYNENIIKLETLYSDFENILKNKVLLNKKNIKITYDTEMLTKLKNNLEKVSENFQKEQTPESLTQGRFLGQYLSISQEFISESKLENKNSWKNFCKKKYNKEALYELEQRIIKTPKNNENLEKFKQKYIIFSELMTKNDLSEEDFSSLEKCSQSLNEIRSNFEENYHEDVKIFLNELNKNNFVTIDLLTDEVKKFINENNFENTFVIKRNNQ